jgi:hypothetical protein
MIRKFAVAAAVSAASLVAFVPPASAQSFGGITLSFGSGGGYGDYDDYDGYDSYQYRPSYSGSSYSYRARPRYDYYQNGYNGYYNNGYGGYYGNGYYGGRGYARHEQLERWQQERARENHWRSERREHQRRHDDDDD